MTDEDFTALGLIAPPTRLDPPGYPSQVAGVVERAAAATPDDLGLVDSRQSFTFSELARAIAAAATLIDAAGIRSGDRIAASLGNEANLVIAFFATMRLGAVWVGINKVLPAADKLFILGHSDARLLLTDSTVAAQLGSQVDDLASLEQTWVLDSPDANGGWHEAQSGPTPVDAPSPPIDPFAPATIMYTSGTTGVPKGVVHSQHNMIIVPAAGFAHGLMHREARRGSALPLTITNVMILGPLSAFLAGKPFLFAPSAKIGPLVDWINEKQIEQISFVPAMVYDLLQADRDLPSCLVLGTGGAPLPEMIREQFYQRYGYHIMTSYGLTEAPTVVAQPLGDVAPEGASGKAMPHLEITIRDEDGNILPTGTVGEVCFSTTRSGPWAGVYTPPLGYWRDGEKSRALLRGGVVHSGDHGRLDGDGWLSIADRSSELILRGGSNVYPAEIERVLHTHADVADCAVVGKSDLRMGMLTVAFIQAARANIDPEWLEAELRTLCSANLSRYKVPDEWRFIEAMPRNAMGKVIKPRLRELVAETN